MIRLHTFQALLVLSLVATAGSAAEWPQLRGPRGNGHVASGHLPVEWNESTNIKWKTPICGAGHSSPVVVENQVWVTTALESSLPPDEVQRRLDPLHPLCCVSD